MMIFRCLYFAIASHPSLLCRLCFPSGVALSSTRSRFIKQQRDWAWGYQRSDTPSELRYFLRSATFNLTHDDDDDDDDEPVLGGRHVLS